MSYEPIFYLDKEVLTAKSFRDDQRLLTIMEVRRAQGFVDEDILIGLPKEQWKIVGNSVARPVALALGASLRKAWLANSMALPNGAHSAELGLSTKLLECPATREARSVVVVIDADSASSQLPASMAILDERENALASSEAQALALSSAPGEPLIKDIVEKSTLSPRSAGPEDDDPDKTFLHNTLRPNSVQTQMMDSETVEPSRENGHTPRYASGTFHKASDFNGKTPSSHTHQFAEKSSPKQTSPSISPNARFITRETTISKVTIEKTTTILREQIEPSPEL